MDGKKGRIKFYVSDEIALLKLIIAENPFQHEEKYEVILNILKGIIGKPFTLRNIKDRIHFLLREFSKPERVILRKSGTEDEYQEKKLLLEEVSRLAAKFNKRTKLKALQKARAEGTEKREAALEREVSSDINAQGANPMSQDLGEQGMENVVIREQWGAECQNPSSADGFEAISSLTPVVIIDEPPVEPPSKITEDTRAAQRDEETPAAQHDDRPLPYLAEDLPDTEQKICPRPPEWDNNRNPPLFKPRDREERPVDERNGTGKRVADLSLFLDDRHKEEMEMKKRALDVEDKRLELDKQRLEFEKLKQMQFFQLEKEKHSIEQQRLDLERKRIELDERRTMEMFKTLENKEKALMAMLGKVLDKNSDNNN